LRRRFWPGYKANREGKQMPEAVLDAYPQMELLRKVLLPRLGLINQMAQNGYEADDLIARLSVISSSITITVVSSDSDLFQLLGPRCHIYNLGKKSLYTYRDFIYEYGVSPYLWTEIKAIAGDNSDGIDGVPGIGIKTAVKYICGATKFKTAEKVASYKQVVKRNRSLIRLPWPGCDPGPVQRSRFNDLEFHQICVEWGIKSI
jgi:DNA polymerase I